MKNLLSFLALVGIVLVSNCTSIPENNDPIIGIWSNEEVTQINAVSKERIREEWIFNDAYLGRFHRYDNNTLEFINDFKWSEEDGVYTISYPGTDLPDNIVTMEVSEETAILQEQDGEVIAIRE
ncbi:hypothetical protein [Spongiimicrobium salis]|uniref:hypothetical protein n=1 Tax=Spongiimicrobium salis TaxID=1667022 RepID=UPI00374D0E7C